MLLRLSRASLIRLLRVRLRTIVWPRGRFIALLGLLLLRLWTIRFGTVWFGPIVRLRCGRAIVLRRRLCGTIVVRLRLIGLRTIRFRTIWFRPIVVRLRLVRFGPVVRLRCGRPIVFRRWFRRPIVIRLRLVGLRTIWLRPVVVWLGLVRFGPVVRLCCRRPIIFRRRFRRPIVIRLRLIRLGTIVGPIVIRLRLIRFRPVVVRSRLIVRTIRLRRVCARTFVACRWISRPVRWLVRRGIAGLVARASHGRRSRFSRRRLFHHRVRRRGAIHRTQTRHVLPTKRLAGMLLQRLLTSRKRHRRRRSSGFSYNLAIRDCSRWCCYSICSVGARSQHAVGGGGNRNPRVYWRRGDLPGVHAHRRS